MTSAEPGRKVKLLEQWRKITATPGVYLILGDQGTGKSGLGYFILELYSGRPVFVLALPQSAWKHLARQKCLRLIFIAQESRFIDVSILSRSQALLVKEPALFQARTERPEVVKIIEMAREEFDRIEGDRRRFTYIHSRNFRGMIENFCPSFYCDGLSNAFANVDVVQGTQDPSGTRSAVQPSFKSPFK